MRIGYFEHWSRPQWCFIEFIREQGVEVEKIDYSQKNYLENLDLLIIEQNGFNDYIENDEIYIRDWAARGGIIWFMHQNYERWAPYFLPHELGYTQLIHRYVPTVRLKRKHMCYMMPWLEDKGKVLFEYPEKITGDELLGWKIQVNSFPLVSDPEHKPETVETAALSCFLANEKWDVLGSYMDPAVKDGSLILQGKVGKGMYFISQILVPEVLDEGAGRCLAFWKKFLRNIMWYFEAFKHNTPLPVIEKGSIAEGKRNYKLTIHMHSLDWFGCDSAPGTMNAMMRYMDYDICAFAVKDAAPYDGKLDPGKYSDDKVLFLDGQEYHPFNWNDSNDHISHNCYHMVVVGVDHDAYTQEFTRSLFSDEEIDAYLKKALDYVHRKNGAAVATHPGKAKYWFDYDYDGVDMEPMKSLQNTPIEEFYLAGGRIAIMNSVDLFGFQRIVDNPAVNMVYLADGKPCRDSVVKAIRSGHTIAATGFSEGDITCNGVLPGSEIPANGEKTVHVTATVDQGNIKEVRIFADDQIIVRDNPDMHRIDKDYILPPHNAEKFIRVELTGENELTVMNSTPFYVAEK